MEATYNTQAIVLKRKHRGESDLEIDLYTPFYGRVSFCARGALKKGAKLAGHLEPITLGNFMIIRGRQSDYIGSAQGENFYLNIKEDLEKLKYARLVLKVLDKYMRRQDPLPLSFFQTLQDYLQILDSSEEKDKYDLLYSAFLLKFVFFLGFSPEFEHCVACSGKLEESKIGFDIAGGGVLCPTCLSSSQKKEEIIIISSPAFKLLRFLAQEDFIKINKLKISLPVLRETFNLLNYFYKYHL